MAARWVPRAAFNQAMAFGHRADTFSTASVIVDTIQYGQSMKIANIQDHSGVNALGARQGSGKLSGGPNRNGSAPER
ncbi:hypothetical protein [Consotaella salsifontis]|uniref:hypothetical protein n=1 Tax=Consotaella salsifontis TaxID=1365950 RepID=UPI00105527D8|nr:hypothetical protein [Consotaella salsifontis]